MSLLHAVVRAGAASGGGLRGLALATTSNAASKASASSEPASHLKRPPNAFLLFKNEKMKTWPTTASAKDVAKQMGEEWNKLTESQKQPYQDKFKAAMALYRTAKEKVPEEVVQKAKEITDGKKVSKKLKELKNEMKELTVDKPKKPHSAYVIYVTEQLIKNTELKSLDRMKAAASGWEKLAENKKAEYEKRSKEQGHKYLSELKAWEEKILKDGRHAKIESVKKQLM